MDNIDNIEQNNNKSPQGLNSLAPKVAQKHTPTKKITEPTIVKSTTKTVQETKEQPLNKTYSGFNIGDTKYNIIDDNSTARKMIIWDDKGNVDPNSPVQIIGKNIDGGFILAALDKTKGVNKTPFAYTKEKGINFHTLESDEPGTVRMQSLHNQNFAKLSDVINTQAASKLRGIYKRTKQL